MTLTAQQFRARAGTCNGALVVQIAIPGGSTYYIGDYTDPIQIAGVHMNPLLKSIDGLSVGDSSQTSDITLRLANKKEQTQDRNPLVEPVKMTDLIASGLGEATITIKEAVLGIQARTITSWTSADLVTLFVGSVRTPFEYDEEAFALSATADEMAADEELPDERVGEASTASPEGDTTIIPIHVGNNSPWQDYWGSVNLAVLAEEVAIGRALDGAEAPLYKFPSDQAGMDATYVASGRLMDSMSDVLVNVGMPGSCIMPRRYRTDSGYIDQYATRQADGRQYIDLKSVGGFYVYYPERMATDPARLGLTADWRILAKEYGEITLAPGETAAIGVNSSTPSIPTVLQAVIFYLRAIAVPAGAKLQAEIQFYSRDGTRSFTLYTRTFWSSELQAGGLWTSRGNWSAALEKLRHDSPYWDDKYGDTEWSDDKLWYLFGSVDGLRLLLTRTDLVSGDLTLGGAYSLPFFRCFSSAKSTASLWQPRVAPTIAKRTEQIRADLENMTIATGGDGVATAGYEATTKQAHPRHIYHYLLTEELGKDPAEVDIETRDQFVDTVNWRLGFALTSAEKKRALLDRLQEQSTMRCVKDTDGIYRLRVMARGGAVPTWQRFGYTLEPGVDALNIKVTQPGPDYVENAISVKYQGGQRTAWVTPTSSGDGYGNELPDWEAVAAASYAKYGLRRWDIDAWAVHDSVTAVGILQYYLSRHAIRSSAEMPNVVTFNTPKLGAYLHVGQYVDFLASGATGMDAKFLLGGATWGSVYFQIDKKSRWSDRWQFTATQVPTIALTEFTMTIRPIDIVVGP
jgi:hypothetical protein